MSFQNDKDEGIRQFFESTPAPSQFDEIVDHIRKFVEIHNQQGRKIALVTVSISPDVYILFSFQYYSVIGSINRIPKNRFRYQKSNY